MNENSMGKVNYEGQSAYDVADMLKQFFRDLPEPLTTNKLSETFLQIYQCKTWISLIYISFPYIHISLQDTICQAWAFKKKVQNRKQFFPNGSHKQENIHFYFLTFL